MKLLIVNTSDIHGGAARAAYRLHKSLQSVGVESRMLVQSKTGDDISVLGPVSFKQRVVSKLRPHLDGLIVRRYKKRVTKMFSPAILPFSGRAKEINRSNADIVHLHWIARGMFRIEELARITKPIVWTLHDMWPFTGGCHTDSGCGKFLEICGKCPSLGSTRSNDLSFNIYRRKKLAYARISELHVVCPSNWLAGCAKESTLFKNKPVTYLPNPIDTNIYKPLEKKIARDFLDLSYHAPIVLFGAMYPIHDINKGFHELAEALGSVTTKHTEFMIFGAGQPLNDPALKLPAHYMGRLHDDISLRIVYSVADVMVVPSRQENLSNVIMESLACGTPVVAFNIGGNPDMIEHQQNGYLAEPFDPADLGRGIDWVLNHPNPEVLSQNAREKVVREFDSKVIAKRYVDLYEEILERNDAQVSRQTGLASN
jgi:glycosyltransferase involved in cell wall biosynthesis